MYLDWTLNQYVQYQGVMEELKMSTSFRTPMSICEASKNDKFTDPFQRMKSTNTDFDYIKTVWNNVRL